MLFFLSTTLILISFALLFYSTVRLLKSGYYPYDLTFAFGTLLGAVYFLCLPLFITFLNQELNDYGVLADAYRPFEDLSTTFNLMLGWFVVLLAVFYERHYKRYYIKAITDDLTLKSLGLGTRGIFLVVVMVCLYLGISLYGLSARGLTSVGSHWHNTGNSLLSKNPIFSIIFNFANCYRLALFGLWLYLCERKDISRQTAILLGISLTCFDLFVTFNRITIAYFVLFFLILLRKHFWKITVFLLIAAPTSAKLSVIWTWFRSSATDSGYSISSFINAWTSVNAAYNESADSSFLNNMNGIFESSNIQVFSHLVKNVGDSIPILYGYTYLLRPLTTFVPSSIWQNKPRPFGSYLGVYINDVEGLSLNSTLFGEVFTNFYFIWPVVLFISIVLLSRFYAALSKFIPGLQYVGLFVGFALWRFDMNFAIAALYALFAAIGIAYLIRFIFRVDHF